ncbi:hypothetical protein ICN35_08635 [Polynucleobacter sp. es-GGE-1]|uniref:O-antigen ligase family protein n=1 Tax=Polynucleobacter sp. es-GGE-1 TaxID=1819724 RepID=UPI001C0DA3EF|nr:O-antigen ligase family protein [Polynucleobacter sp. es-GGE-1]MBU3635524.1 hypothetical protein [Polynucleobacter sp. es-GGE-1]
MQAFKNISDQKYSLLNWLEFSLIILSSVLLGIWAAANTIALRNILLVLGALLSIAYFYQLHRQDQLKQYFSVRNSIPLCCIVGLFLWVLAHCFLFPTDYVAQIDELKSTWLRSALAAVVGVATGIAIARNPAKIYWLWIGMILCFVYLLGQYLIDVWYMQKLFTERYMQYIFVGKVNGVLIGSILVSTILGTSISLVYKHSKYKIALGVIGIFAIALVLFSYIYILETRNGFLVVIIMIAVWCIFEFRKITQEKKQSKNFLFKKILAISLVAIVAIFALVKHIERTPQWLNLAEDILISTKVDKYSAWQHAEDAGPPVSESGRIVSANTYTRIAWFTVGLKLLPEVDYWGHGVLNLPFQRVLDHSRYRGAIVKSTHCGWLDLYFSLGVPGILLMIGALLIIFFENLRHLSGLIMLTLSLLLLFFVSEVSRQHCIEILFYFIAFLVTAKSFQNVQHQIGKIP